MAKKTKSNGKALPETVTPLAVRVVDGDNVDSVRDLIEPGDFVIVSKGAMGVGGVPTSTKADTRKLASSPGMFSWLANLPLHPTNRKLGFKFTLILSSPVEEKATKAKNADDDDAPTMSAIV